MRRKKEASSWVRWNVKSKNSRLTRKRSCSSGDTGLTKGKSKDSKERVHSVSRWIVAMVTSQRVLGLFCIFSLRNHVSPLSPFYYISSYGLWVFQGESIIRYARSSLVRKTRRRTRLITFIVALKIVRSEGTIKRKSHDTDYIRNN